MATAVKEERPQIVEARRYLKNARDILSTKAGKRGNYYEDPKYVSMACNTAWSGVLIAVCDKMERNKFAGLPKKGNRLNVDIFRNYLGEKNRSILKDFNAAYNYLHLLGGYDKNLHVKGTATGLELAEKIIDWCS